MVTAAHLTTGANATNGASYNTASVTPSANALLLVWVSGTGTNSVNPPTLTGAGVTWDLVDQAHSDGNVINEFLFRALHASPGSGALNIAWGSGNVTGCNWTAVEFADVDTSGTNGAGAVAETLPGNASATSVVINLVDVAAGNATAGGFATTDDIPVTPGSGYTELGEAMHNNPGTVIQSEWRSDGATLVDASWGTAQNSVGIAVEIQAAGGGSGQTVTPTGIASAEAHGTATLTAGSVNLAPTGIASSEAHGSPTLTTGAATLTPTGIGSAEAFGTATVTAGGSTVTPTGIGSLEAFGAAVVAAGAVTVAPGGIASGEAFGTATVSSGGSFIQPSGIASAEAFGTAVASSGAVTIAPTGITTVEAFGTLTVTTGDVALVPTGIATAEAFGTASVADPDAARDIHITGAIAPTSWAAVALHKSVAATLTPTPWSAT